MTRLAAHGFGGRGEEEGSCEKEESGHERQRAEREKAARQQGRQGKARQGKVEAEEDGAVQAGR
jgi:hypothetical protein